MAKSIGWIGFCALVASHVAGADILDRVDNSWRVTAGFLHQDYRESNPGINPNLTAPIVDQEQGALPAVSLRLRQQSEGVYSEFRATAAGGSDRYSGYSCLTVSPYTCSPYATHTNNLLLTGDFRLGPILGDASVRVVPFLGGGVSSWVRDIQGSGSVQSTSETYRFGYLGAGALMQMPVGRESVWSVEGLIATTVHPIMNTQGQNFTLGASPMWSVQTDLDVPLASPWWMTATLAATGYRFGASPLYNVGSTTLMEPASRTEQWIAEIGVGRSF